MARSKHNSNAAQRNKDQHATRRDQRAGKQVGKQAGHRSQKQARAHRSRQHTTERQYIQGRRAVAEAIAAGVPLKRALVQAGDMSATLTQLVVELEAQGVPIELVSQERLNKIAGHIAHQGIAVEPSPYDYASINDIILAAGTSHALVVVLDHVTDEGNLGAIVRSCEVLGAAGLVIAKTRAAKVGLGAYKTSAGAVFRIPIAQVANISAALDKLKDAGFWAVGASEHADAVAWHAHLEGRVALVMGSEYTGISRLVLEHCDETCSIPQRGRIESLNVAQATSVLAYEWQRQTWGSAHGS